MGFLSNCNFFTESDFNDYRRLDKILNEADKDDDLNDDESESNFDMPDDEDDNTNQQTQDNPPESSPTNQQDAGDDDLNIAEGVLFGTVDSFGVLRPFRPWIKDLRAEAKANSAA